MVSREPFLECMSSMAAVAGATEKLKFGMNVASVGLRDPLLLAKECATIDFLSDGRLLPAFGIGNATRPRSGRRPAGRPSARHPHQRSVGTDLPPVEGGQRHLRGRVLSILRGLHLTEAGAEEVRSGSADRATRRSGAPRGSAPAGLPVWKRRSASDQ